MIGEPFNRLMEILAGIAKIVKNQKSPLASIINQYFTGNARKRNVEQTSRRFIERSMAIDKKSRSLCVKGKNLIYMYIRKIIQYPQYKMLSL